MPTIARIRGIVVYLPLDDHNPPHFHAQYAGHSVRIHIRTLRVLDGSFPPARLRILLEWAERYQNQIQDRWDAARRGESPAAPAPRGRRRRHRPGRQSGGAAARPSRLPPEPEPRCGRTARHAQGYVQRAGADSFWGAPAALTYAHDRAVPQRVRPIRVILAVGHPARPEASVMSGGVPTIALFPFPYSAGNGCPGVPTGYPHTARCLHEKTAQDCMVRV